MSLPLLITKVESVLRWWKTLEDLRDGVANDRTAKAFVSRRQGLCRPAMPSWRLRLSVEHINGEHSLRRRPDGGRVADVCITPLPATTVGCRV